MQSLGALKLVLKRPAYYLLFVGLFGLFMSVIILVPNSALITSIAVSGATLPQKISFVLSLYGSLLTNFTWWSAAYSVILAILFAINLTTLLFYIRRVQITTIGGLLPATGVGGVLAGLLGIGCAACGSVILSSLALTLGAGGLLAFLPLHGGEFALLGIFLLVYSLWLLLKRLNDSRICTT